MANYYAVPSDGAIHIENAFERAISRLSSGNRFLPGDAARFDGFCWDDGAGRQGRRLWSEVGLDWLKGWPDALGHIEPWYRPALHDRESVIDMGLKHIQEAG